MRAGSPDNGVDARVCRGPNPYNAAAVDPEPCLDFARKEMIYGLT